MVGITILAALVIWAGFFRMHHWRITIKTHKEPQYAIYEVSAKPQDREILFQLQEAICDQAGVQGEPVRKKSSRLLPTIVASIIMTLAIIAAMLLRYPEIFEAKQVDDTASKEPIQSVENIPSTGIEDSTNIAGPEQGHWIYDPMDMISADVEEEILAYDTSWSEKYQSVTAVAAIKNSFSKQEVETTAFRR